MHKMENTSQEQSPIRRIIGIPEDEENSVLIETRRLFKNQEKLPYEREKTERESRIIDGVLSLFPKFLEEYGITALPFVKNHIHIAEKEEYARADKNEADNAIDKIGGFYNVNLQAVVVFPSRDDLLFAGRVAHEMIHGNSFSSLENVDGSFKARRIGLSMVDAEGSGYFHYMNEALTEELAKRFDKKYFEYMPPLKEATAKKKDFIANIKNPRPEIEDVRSVISEQMRDGMWRTTIKEYEYAEERKDFLKLINDLHEKNREQSHSSEDIFRMFVRAAFTGRVLELARFIEDAFGDGSFSEFGKRTMGRSMNQKIGKNI